MVRPLVNQRARSRKLLFHMQPKNGHLSIIKLLLGSGHVDIDRKDNNGKPFLIHAVEEGHSDIVQELLRNDANVEVKDDLSWTPLM